MVHEGALLESQTLRASVAERTEALDKVKTLSLLPDGVHVTTRMVARYFEVSEHAVGKLVQRHRDELTERGMRTLRGSDLEFFKKDILSSFPESYPQPRSNLTLFTRRAVLNVAMLLRDSDVARRVRTYLLDTEQASRAESPGAPVDDAVVHSLVEWLDQWIAACVAEQGVAHAAREGRVREIAEEAVRGVVGRTVVPLLNQVMHAHGELRRRLAENEAETARLSRVVREYGAVCSMAALDAMDAREFERHVAWLCRRDGCAEMTATRGDGRGGGTGDGFADMLGHTADGRRLVVRCRTRHSGAHVTGGDVLGFAGVAKLEYEADVALLVASAPFTRDALLVAARHEVTAVHRGLLEAWNKGARLRVLQ
ncbi:Restriction endonuclease [Streptomyces sp. WMMB 714]|uniref:restriction endonuclease n=1 Tax=Streptomyces sp. WMMB 714 TaxID=1286822 RepID=UPI0005F7CF38|nr:restriction endonuclease [Streptomyces sp. WMMB 714]SCK22211.1 Restriction endonuclease [Streptomyces sp. WMMB 714]